MDEASGLAPGFRDIRYAMIGRIICTHPEISPIPAKSIADLRLEENVYKPDFEIASKFQSFSKELLRISFLGLGVFGFLIKLAVDEKEQTLLHALQRHEAIAIVGVAAFAVCSGCALFHVFLTSKCLLFQLNILRYLGRLESDRWNERDKEESGAYIRRQRLDQKCAIRNAGRLLFVATGSLALGAVLVAYCAILTILNK